MKNKSMCITLRGSSEYQFCHTGNGGRSCRNSTG